MPASRLLIAVVNFNCGIDCLLFRTTDAISLYKKEMGIEGYLQSGSLEDNYMKYLSFNNLIKLDKGMRAEKDNKTALSVTYRKKDMIFGLIGGICQNCQTEQFPRNSVCVNPECGAIDSQKPLSFANKPAKILSWSADHLTYTPDPPHHYGMVTFAGGGRFMADFTDCEAGKVSTGMTLKMVFRVKAKDDVRGFTRYFWKAAPGEALNKEAN